MEYQALGSSYERVPQRSESKGQIVWGWINNAIVWVLLGVLIYIKIAHPKSLKPFAIATGIAYALYLFFMFSAPTFNYLRHKNTDAGMYAKMGELFRTPPEINFSAECYHNIRHTHTNRNKNGRKTSSTSSTKKVVTHRESRIFPYYSAKDVSGLFLLNIEEAKAKSKAYIKLKLGTEVNFADAISYSDYIYQKEAFWRRNRYLDTYMNFSEERKVPGLKRENLIRLTDKEPPCISVYLYALFSILTFGQFYKLYVDSCCAFQYYKIRKLVSTRYNLMSEAYSQQYSSLNPELNLFQQQYTYKPQETGYVFEANKFQPPTQQELEKAKQYQQYVPNYSFQSVGGNAGIVQDIPQFQNVNYNQPPPGFENLGGDVALSSDQLKSASQIESISQGAQQNPVVQGAQGGYNNMGNQGYNSQGVGYNSMGNQGYNPQGVQQNPVVQGAQGVGYNSMGNQGYNPQGVQQNPIVQGAQGVGYNNMGNQGYNPQGVQQNPVVQGAQGVGYNNMGNQVSNPQGMQEIPLVQGVQGGYNNVNNQVSNPQGGQEIPIQGNDSNQQVV